MPLSLSSFALLASAMLVAGCAAARATSPGSSPARAPGSDSSSQAQPSAPAAATPAATQSPAAGRNASTLQLSWTATLIDLEAGGVVRVDGVAVADDAALGAAVAAAWCAHPSLRGLVIAHPSIATERRSAVVALVRQAGVAEVDLVEVPFVELGAGTAPATASPGSKAAPARPRGSQVWQCAFPYESFAAGVDSGRAEVVVVVDVDGAPKAVAVKADSGHGYGRSAAACAMTKRYVPGRDASGQPVETTTPPIRTVFGR